MLRFFAALVWLRRAVGKMLGRRKTIYVADRVDEYRAIWTAAAQAIGADFRPLATDIWEVRSGDRSTRIANGLLQFDDPVVLDLAGDKSFCYGMARDLGIPTAEPRTFSRRERAKALREIPLDGRPYVVKPAKGTGSGVGVTVGVKSRLGLASAMALASFHSSRIIVERLVAAESVRLLFLDGAMIHAVRRRGARVEGDGRSTVAALMARLRPAVPMDDFARETFRQQGRSVEDVLPAGTSMVVRWLAPEIGSSRELRTIYDEVITHLVGAPLVEEVAPLVAKLGSDFVGIDLITNDPSRSLAESGGVFLEMNTTPGMHHHCTLGEGEGEGGGKGEGEGGAACAVAVTVLRRLLDRESK